MDGLDARRNAKRERQLDGRHFAVDVAITKIVVSCGVNF
jgi:hypothetical protein